MEMKEGGSGEGRRGCHYVNRIRIKKIASPRVKEALRVKGKSSNGWKDGGRG